MRKFLSVALVAIMVLSMLPMTFINSAAAVSAPTTLPDGTQMALTSVTDGTATYTKKSSKWVKNFENATKTVFDDGNIIDTSNCKGMLFKIETTSGASALFQFYFNFKDENGTSQQVKGNSVNFYWWNGSSWVTKTAGGTSYTVPSVEGYLYVDFSVLKLNSSKVSDICIYSPSDTRFGIVSEWSIVQTPEQAESNPLIPTTPPVEPETPAITAPTTLPDATTKIFYKSVTDGTLVKQDGVSAGAYSTALENKTYSIFENGTQDLANYKGFIVKANATGTGKLYLRYKFKMANGTEVEIKSNNRPLAWYDGTSWSELAGASSNWQTPIGEGYAFLAFPLDDFGANGTLVSDIQVYSSNGSGRIGEFSEWSLVYTADQVITGASVSLTDDLALNVSANAPAGCTDAKLTFTFNGITSEAALKDGKYSLEGILPQQISEPVTATWTGTVNGETLTDTVTTSVADYCKTVLATESLADWHELAKALLHYGAAAEAKTGYTDTLSNAGIAAVTNPVDLSAITATAVNNDSQVWKGATLRLDGAIALKVRLNAPEGVDTVTATVDGRANAVTLNIVDGYVTLALNAYELSKNVTFSYGDDAKTLVISADYVLKNTTDAGYSALAQAVANYGKEAGARKNPA